MSFRHLSIIVVIFVLSTHEALTQDFRLGSFVHPRTSSSDFSKILASLSRRREIAASQTPSRSDQSQFHKQNANNLRQTGNFQQVAPPSSPTLDQNRQSSQNTNIQRPRPSVQFSSFQLAQSPSKPSSFQGRRPSQQSSFQNPLSSLQPSRFQNANSFPPSRFPSSGSSSFQQPSIRPLNDFSSFGLIEDIQPSISGSAADDTVSPFWADPDGRRSPPPPIIPPAALTSNLSPCNLSDATPACDPFERYRNIDGSCNNLAHPTYGRTHTVLQRMFRHREDPTMMRRVSVIVGRLLPNPRLVSEAIRHAPPRPTQRDTNLLFMVFGQFIDHDMILVPVARDPSNHQRDLRCTSCNSWTILPACAPIPVPDNDQFFRGPDSPRCLPFTRSLGLPVLGPSNQEYIEQVNLNTAYLDLSTVYGSDSCLSRELRAYVGGQLLTTNTASSPYGLPLLTGSRRFSACKTPFHSCYFAGDARSNEHAALLTIHTLFLREHNHLAKELHKINPAWDDEKLFQEARRLNIAQYQHMVMTEFLPRLLGNSPLLEFYRLAAPPSPFSSDVYQPQSNAQILQEFSSAAFRVGHTFVPDDFILSDEDLKPIASLSLAEVFDDPTVMQKSAKGTIVDALMRGLLSTRLQGSDLSVVDSLRDRLFETKGIRYSGHDLVARNIARGRDHGIAPYTAYRTPCRQPPVHSWQDLNTLIPLEHIDMLMTVYDHWDDVDLFVGGLAENVVDDGLVGPTFACIIALQFYISKVSDRFWYDNSQNGFTLAELSTVYQYGQLSNIISRNMDNQDSLVPRDALRLPNVRSNPAIVAGKFAEVNLAPWIDSFARRPKSCLYREREFNPGELVNVSPCLDCHCTGDGNLHCEDQPVDCGVLHQFVHQSQFDEYCHRLCPSPLLD
uniref:Chorion peroxidase-like n=1 Tax=Hirondellea gigas TaxID=1518452 RepID=A0A2P2HWN0_9CRUS